MRVRAGQTSHVVTGLLVGAGLEHGRDARLRARRPRRRARAPLRVADRAGRVDRVPAHGRHALDDRARARAAGGAAAVRDGDRRARARLHPPSARAGGARAAPVREPADHARGVHVRRDLRVGDAAARVTRARSSATSGSSRCPASRRWSAPTRPRSRSRGWCRTATSRSRPRPWPSWSWSRSSRPWARSAILVVVGRSPFARRVSASLMSVAATGAAALLLLHRVW